jgi:hypothetical protein
VSGANVALVHSTGYQPIALFPVGVAPTPCRVRVRHEVLAALQMRIGCAQYYKYPCNSRECGSCAACFCRIALHCRDASPSGPMDIRGQRAHSARGVGAEEKRANPSAHENGSI